MKIKVSHIRYDKDGVLVLNSRLKRLGELRYVRPQGGVTIAWVSDGGSRGEDGIGFAFCSKRDNYNKKIGRMIATGRALKDLKESKAISPDS